MNNRIQRVFVEHGFVVYKMHTSVLKTVHTKSLWMCNYMLTYFKLKYIWYSVLEFARVFRSYMTVHVFFFKLYQKYLPNAHWIRFVSVLFDYLFFMQISLSLNIFM